MKVTYYGHSSFGISLKSCKLIIDPFITPNKNANFEVESIKADFVLISHGHQDHIYDAEAIAKNNAAVLVSNFEIANYFSKLGIEAVVGMNHGGTSPLGETSSVKMVNAIHSSSFPDGSYAGNPAGFIIRDGSECIYFAGDTALHSDMELIGKYEKPSVAILPIGDLFTMGIQDAAFAAKMCQVKKVIGCHYDTFPPIEIDKSEAKRIFKNNGVELILMELGQTITT